MKRVTSRAWMARERAAVERKIRREERLFENGFLKGAQQALAWVMRENAMRPSACVHRVPRRRGGA